MNMRQMPTPKTRAAQDKRKKAKAEADRETDQIKICPSHRR
jgi:hypothetical protein